jgi:hypothetical protein
MQMTKLDAIFEQVRAVPAPDALAGIEAPVLAGLSMRQEQAMSRRGLVLAGAIAMVIGTFASVFPASEARAVSVFGVPAAAPSNLLVR